MHAIPQLVSAPLNPIPIAEHFSRSHPPCEHSHGQCISEENNAFINFPNSRILSFSLPDPRNKSQCWEPWHFW